MQKKRTILVQKIYEEMLQKLYVHRFDKSTHPLLSTKTVPDFDKLEPI